MSDDNDIYPVPTKLYLQLGAGEEGTHTWCEDRIEDDDVEYIAMTEYDALRTQLAAVTAELQAYRDDRQRVMAEQCAPDERHCTCVPGLREEISILKTEQQEMQDYQNELIGKLQQARAYVTALVEAMTAEQFCGLVEAGKVDGIRAWLEGGE